MTVWPETACVDAFGKAHTMNTSIVLTVVSDDHPGIVEMLSERIAAHGGPADWNHAMLSECADTMDALAEVSGIDPGAIIQIARDDRCRERGSEA